MDTVVSLGGFAFRNLEIPSELNLGGEQKLKIHELVGGARQIDAMGSCEGVIAWEGLMTGADAFIRAQELDGMRIAGQSLIFSVFNAIYNVILKDFTFTPERYYKVRYKIGLAVIQNLSVSALIANVLSFTDSILSDIGNLSTLTNSLNNSSLSVPIAGLNTAITNAGSFDSASMPTLNGISSQISSVQSQVTSQINSVRLNLFGF